MPLPACTAGTAVLPVLLYCLWVCRVSEALARFLFQQLVLALSFCHGRGVVCRGLKLANTLLALAPGQLPLLKLGDFSVSKDTARHSAPASQVWPEDGMMKTHTLTTHMYTHTKHTDTRCLDPPLHPLHLPLLRLSASCSQVGAALFVPPEVMHNFSGAAYDGAAADVWAAGIVLFVLLFGRHPFLRPEDAGLPEAGQMLALFTRTAASAFGLLPEEAAAISPGCADMLAAVLQTSPAARCGQMLPDCVHVWVGAHCLVLDLPMSSSPTHLWCRCIMGGCLTPTTTPPPPPLCPATASATAEPRCPRCWHTPGSWLVYPRGQQA